MKFIRTFELFNFEYGSDWEIGDIIVGTTQMYTDNGDWIIPGDKYEIIDFGHKNTTVKIKNIKNNRIYVSRWLKINFTTEEDWNLQQTANKYNL